MSNELPTLTLKRTYYKKFTAGVIDLPDGSSIETLELPWLNNIEDESCIPEGEYIIERDTTGKHQWYRFKFVEGRENIEFHPANYLHQLNGCIAPATKVINGVGSFSINACVKLVAAMGNKTFKLVITS